MTSLPQKYVLIVFFLILLLGAMILGPLLYFGLAFIMPTPFHRVMDRALLISAVGALGLFWHRLSLSRLWPWKRGIWVRVLFGCIMAAVTVQAIIGLKLVFDGFTLADLAGRDVAHRFLIATIAALFIPFLEETLFRGFIQSELVRNLGWRWGWLTAAFIFMLAHFLKIPVELDHQPVHLWSGATAFGAAFSPLVNGDFLCGRGLNLFLVGLILGGIFLRSDSLWLNAGLHGGWIFALLLFSGLTRSGPGPYSAFLGGDMLSTPLTTVVFILLGIWLWLFYHPLSTAPATGASVR